MATAERLPGRWTYAKYLELDDETRYEIIGGDLVMVPAPGVEHQRIVRRLGLRMAQYVEDAQLGEVLFAPTDVVLREDEVVQPDILFVRAPRVGEVVRSRAVHGAPDLVVEILSPGSLLRDRHEKRELYARAGVAEYWIVDPANRSIEVFALGESGYELFSSAEGTGAAASRVLEGFAAAVAEVMPG